MNIERITEEDKAYLEKFSIVELLALNVTKLVSCDNLPDIQSLKRVIFLFCSYYFGALG